MFAYCDNNPANKIDSTGNQGKGFDLGQGWKYCFDPANPSGNIRRHIHIWNEKKGVSYAQNDDGSPHDKNKNSQGKLPRWLNDKLIEKTGWDYNGKREDFFSSTEVAFGEFAIQYSFADGTTTFTPYMPFMIQPRLTISEYEAFYFSGELLDSYTYPSEMYFLPLISPITLPSFSFSFSFGMYQLCLA